MQAANDIGRPASELEARARFRALVERTEGTTFSGLRFDELRELARLYRLHTSALARARERGDDPDAIRELNALCVRAYGFLYGGARASGRAAAGRGGLARDLARTWRPVVAAWLLMALGALVGTGLGLRDPLALPALVPAGLGYTEVQLDELRRSPEARRAFLRREHVPLAERAFFGSSLFVHNTRVGLLALATGVLFAVPTVLLAVYNGLVVGAIAAPFASDPQAALDFAAWIVPHAIPELSAIAACVAGGLLLGGAAAAPGRRSRGRALREASSSALLLFGVSVPLFLVAAAIESFVRESQLGTAPRLVLAAALLALLGAALLAVRRAARRHEPDLSWLGASDPRHSGAPGSDPGAAPRPARAEGRG